MRTIVSFIIVIVVLNASARGGSAYWKYYQFKDAAQQIVLFGGKTETNLLHQQVLDKADKLEVPAGPDDVSVVREGIHTTIYVSYEETVEFFPRFTRPLTFSFSAASDLRE